MFGAIALSLSLVASAFVPFSTFGPDKNTAVPKIVTQVVYPQTAVRAASDATVIVNAEMETVSAINPDELPTTSEVHPICSGVIIETLGTVSYIATAAHCANPDADIFQVVTPTPKTVTFFDGDAGKVLWGWKDSGVDLMILQVRSQRKHHAIAHAQLPYPGDAAFVYGMPGVLQWSFSAGVVMGGIRAIGPWPVAFPLDCASCTHGDSGAGVFDRHGRAVGILVGSATQQEFTVAVPFSEVLKLYRLRP